ncbi:MAG: hypothetical protein N4A74_08475 [Carboxylicivirga sp.]|jgi:hypothetical protein|nr:hypothetical protein [Carboxylicivirga sp.]
MKHILSILMLTVILVGCNQDNEGPLFDAKGIDYVAVGTTSVETPYALNNSNNYSIMFPIHRTDKGTDGTIANLEFVDESGVFELDNDKLSFANGEGLAYAKIVASDPAAIDPAAIYSFTLKVTGDNASPLYHTATFSGQLELKFESLGKGEFNGALGERSVNVFKAEGLEIYKVEGPYADGTDILIIEDATAKTVKLPNQKAWFHSAGYQVYAKGSGSVSTNGAGKKVYSLNTNHYIPDVHDFGVIPEVLVFP